MPQAKKASTKSRPRSSASIRAASSRSANGSSRGARSKSRTTRSHSNRPRRNGSRRGSNNRTTASRSTTSRPRSGRSSASKSSVGTATTSARKRVKTAGRAIGDVAEKATVPALATGAALVGVAGGVALASRNSRKRVLGLPMPTRSGTRQSAGT
jgi:hypothetical protein